MSKDIYMRRCPKCEKQNYIMNVPLGICTWCGYEATEEDINGTTIWVKDEMSTLSDGS